MKQLDKVACEEESFTPELLAPAGDWDCVRAAVASGADAIYFGLQSFNARMRADNFTVDDLPELMAFLHMHGVRGFVTMNTLVFTSELDEAEYQLKLLEQAGVDAVIVQDLGLAWLVRQIAPSLELHASTQMTVTSPEGYRFLDDLFHVERVVLARELSLKELKKFPKETPLEVFVHGALCVAYSGQCLTSESLGQRSANRGECAQACRMPYELIVDGELLDLGEQRYLLSPQDLAAVDLIDDLVKQGVRSFKIEGRLKSPDYVAAVTKVYRKAIDAALEAKSLEESVTERDRYALEMTFSRGLSTGWLEGTNHPKLTHGRFGKKRGVFLGEIIEVDERKIRLRSSSDVMIQENDGVVFDAGEDRDREQGGRVWKVEDDCLIFHNRAGINWDRVKVGQKLWKTDDPILNKEIRKSWEHFRIKKAKKPLTFRVEGKVGEPMRLSCKGVVVESPMALEVALKRPLSDSLLLEKLGRLGETGFKLTELQNELESDVILPMSALNRLRRALMSKIEALNVEEEVPQVSEKREYVKWMPAVYGEEVDYTDNGIKLSVLCRTIEQIEAALKHPVELLYIDFEDIRRYKEAVDFVRERSEKVSIFLATPRIQKAGEAPFFKLIEKAGADGVLIRNLGAIEFFKHREDLRLIGDFSLNVANPISAKLLMEHTRFEYLTISYDLNIKQVGELIDFSLKDWFELTLHQHMPMFHMEHCVFCSFMSDGTDVTNCGRPCDKHKVYLKDRVGQLHPLRADVGCRNTLYNGRAQTGARYFEDLKKTGLKRFRIELLDENLEEADAFLEAYFSLLKGEIEPKILWDRLGVLEKLGITEGTLLRKE